MKLVFWTVVGIAIFAGIIMVANAQTEVDVETAIYKPDGTVEFCTKHADGSIWCR